MLAGPDVPRWPTTPKAPRCSPRSRRPGASCRRTSGAGVHLALLPMEDADENAVIVNALQRRADVVVQKSLAEGFGLTVAEAMWKARPVVAARVGGIQDQIEDGVTGPAASSRATSPPSASAVSALLADPHEAERMGEAAQERVRDLFLGPRHLGQYVDLLERVLAA